uniref:uncharacterized protein LOC114591339 n=1 Tax=Podarcis muralis TaxID=64176 RepID=UPI00109F3846|nr:uncharacterized protein LOC114591339 [Podarcis muralis]XP_028574095.1 uncharacterized protein LOC114591339 [Podarcis muralis]
MHVIPYHNKKELESLQEARVPPWVPSPFHTFSHWRKLKMIWMVGERRLKKIYYRVLKGGNESERRSRDNNLSSTAAARKTTHNSLFEGDEEGGALGSKCFKSRGWGSRGRAVRHSIPEERGSSGPARSPPGASLSAKEMDEGRQRSAGGGGRSIRRGFVSPGAAAEKERPTVSGGEAITQRRRSTRGAERDREGERCRRRRFQDSLRLGKESASAPLLRPPRSLRPSSGLLSGPEAEPSFARSLHRPSPAPGGRLRRSQEPRKLHGGRLGSGRFVGPSSSSSHPHPPRSVRPRDQQPKGSSRRQQPHPLSNRQAFPFPPSAWKQRQPAAPGRVLTAEPPTATCRVDSRAACAGALRQPIARPRPLSLLPPRTATRRWEGTRVKSHTHS